jgi:hypothetical protein
MKRLFMAVASVGLALFISSAGAEDMSAATIMDRMISVLDNSYNSNKLTIITKKGDKVVGELIAGVARKHLADGNRILLVLLEPESAKGIAYLFRGKQDYSFDQWIYLPFLGRVRNVSGYGIYENFLGTDFTYADLGFSYQKGTHTIMEATKLGSTDCHKIDTTPDKGGFLYSHIISWVSKDTYLPIRQDYYDMSGHLWKQQFYENITRIGNKAVALSIRMMDLRDNTSTEFRTSEIMVDSTLLTDDVFVPEQLKYSLVCPVWEKVCYPKEKNTKE